VGAVSAMKVSLGTTVLMAAPQLRAACSLALVMGYARSKAEMLRAIVNLDGLGGRVLRGHVYLKVPCSLARSTSASVRLVSHAAHVRASNKRARGMLQSE